MPAKVSKTILARQQRVAAILPLLKQMYPDAKCSLNFATPLDLLVATILSAQCTDERVNIVTRDLFTRYRTAKDYSTVPQEKLEKEIQSTGFFRSKAKSIRAMGQALLDRHGGEVPTSMEELVQLAGVGRKTANVVLGNAFGKEMGVVVDTHITRLSNRLGLTKHPSDAVKIEQDLIPIVPQHEWTLFAHLLIHHGRKICQARKPMCTICPLLPHCPAGQKFVKAAGQAVAEKQNPGSKLPGRSKKS